LNGQIIPDLIQKNNTAINKFFGKTKISISEEIVNNINP